MKLFYVGYSNIFKGSQIWRKKKIIVRQRDLGNLPVQSVFAGPPDKVITILYIINE